MEKGKNPSPRNGSEVSNVGTSIVGEEGSGKFDEGSAGAGGDVGSAARFSISEAEEESEGRLVASAMGSDGMVDSIWAVVPARSVKA